MKDLSFVIIGKNAQETIPRLLNSVCANLLPHLVSEIIYVDSASTDRTIAIVSQYPVTIVQLSADQPLCASAGRYIGSRYATAEYILFLDSDMELFGGWLQRALGEMHKDPSIAVITGIVVDTDLSLTTEAIRQIDYPSSDDVKLTDIKFAGGAAMFRSSALTQVGNWNPYIISDEEPELCLRIRNAGFRVMLLEYPVARHYTTPPSAVSTLLARRKRRLYLGQGQTIRAYLNSGPLLRRYLWERGYAMLPASVILLTIVLLTVSWATMNDRWLLYFLGALGIVVVGDVIRTQSLRRPLFHMVHRAVVFEGTIKGFLMHPHRPEEFQAKTTVLDCAGVASGSDRGSPMHETGSV